MTSVRGSVLRLSSGIFDLGVGLLSAALIFGLYAARIPAAEAGASQLPAEAPTRESIAAAFGSAALRAWDGLQIADDKIGLLLASDRLAEIPAQTEVIKSAIAIISANSRISDESQARRLHSVVREITGIADRLAVAAQKGKRAQADTIHANLRKYVDFGRRFFPGNVSNAPAQAALRRDQTAMPGTEH